jgi:hypothetical protein
VKHRPERDFLELHGALRERIRLLSVRPMPAERGQYGRQSGWMRMTPASGDYVDDDAPARRMIAADEVYVVCPGLELDGHRHVFTLGPSARPTRATRRGAELDGDPVVVEVLPTGAFNVLGDTLTGTLAFDFHYPLG